jgi:DNA recombination protein RmuC
MQNVILTITTFVAGLLVGGAVVWFTFQARMKTQAAWGDTFKALAADTLRANNESFLQLAETRLKQSEQKAAAALEQKTTAVNEMVTPVKETLQKMDEQLRAIELKREGAYQQLMESVKMSHEAHVQLRGETSQLLQALRAPTSRGHWGEMQLRRILEMSGLSEHAHDFQTQQHIQSDDGALRPDVIVNLPGERCIIVDSKVPLMAYLDATQTADEPTRLAALKSHARQVREHVRLLSAKAYWDQVDGTPEFVVLFMPGDHFLGAALDGDPELMDFCVKQKIILATPMTLIALLRTVAYGWRQESLRENAQRIGQLGSELYAALVTMTEHLTALGGKLSGSIDSYNKLLGSLERNVISKARRLRDFGAGKEGKSLPEAIEPIEVQSRGISSPDMLARGKEDAADAA